MAPKLQFRICPRCRRKIRAPKIVYPVHCRCGKTMTGPPRGLGDVLAWLLHGVGITPERVSRLLGRPCGCKQKQRDLNELFPFEWRVPKWLRKFVR